MPEACNSGQLLAVGVLYVCINMKAQKHAVKIKKLHSSNYSKYECHSP